jgi:hypothetical protein
MSEVRDLINTIVGAHTRLRELGVMRTQRFHADLGEWLAEIIFNGSRSSNPIEKHWDVLIDKRKVQVKTHAKSSSNSNARTLIKCDDQRQFDELILIILSQAFYIKAIYRISKAKLKTLLDADSKISWKKLSKFQIPNDQLSRIDAIRPFLITQMNDAG